MNYFEQKSRESQEQNKERLDVLYKGIYAHPLYPDLIRIAKVIYAANKHVINGIIFNAAKIVIWNKLHEFTTRKK